MSPSAVCIISRSLAVSAPVPSTPLATSSATAPICGFNDASSAAATADSTVFARVVSAAVAEACATMGSRRASSLVAPSRRRRSGRARLLLHIGERTVLQRQLALHRIDLTFLRAEARTQFFVLAARCIGGFQRDGAAGHARAVGGEPRGLL